MTEMSVTSRADILSAPPISRRLLDKVGYAPKNHKSKYVFSDVALTYENNSHFRFHSIALRGGGKGAISNRFQLDPFQKQHAPIMTASP